MGVLDAVLKVRELEQQQAQANVDTMMKGIELAQANQKANMLADLQKNQTMAELAKSGLSMDTGGNVTPASADVISTLTQMNEKDPLTQMISQQRLEDSQTRMDETKRKNLQQDVTNLGNDLDPNRFRAGAFGVATQVFQRGERLMSLVDQAEKFQQGGLDKRQMEEFAIGLNSMLQGGNIGAMEQVRALVPKTLLGNTKMFTEWLTNNPQGLDQQQFVDRMTGTLKREMDTTKVQMDRVRYQRLGKWEDLRKRAPDEWDNVVRNYGVDPDQYDAWKPAGRPPIDAVQQSSGKDNVFAAFADAKKADLPSGTIFFVGSKQYKVK